MLVKREVVLEDRGLSVVDVWELVLAGLGFFRAEATGVRHHAMLSSTLASMTRKGWAIAGWLAAVGPSSSVSSLTGRQVGNSWASAVRLHRSPMWGMMRS